MGRYPVSEAPGMGYPEARRQAIALLKKANLETAGFTAATLAGGFKFDVGDKALSLNYTRYRGLLDDHGVPAQTVCGYEYLDDISVTEYSNKYWQWAVPLGSQCDNLAVYLPDKESSLAFARALSALKKAAEQPAPAAAGLGGKDLAAIVQAAVAGATKAQGSSDAPQTASDVDKPSFHLAERPDDFALVIGIGKYSDLPEASFAENDARAVKNHLLAMGFPSRNVVQLFGEKAGRSSMEKFLETWLPRNVKEDSRVFFYFSGHGAPDPETGEAYLVPWDGDPSFLENTGYPIKRLYAKLSGLRAKEVIVVMDACFSGAGGRSVLPKGARPLVVKVDAATVPQNLTVFAAASGNQITSTLEDQGHGTFTYYFLKGLDGGAKDASGAVTAKGLYDYLRPKVEDAARRQNRDQEPVLRGVTDREIAQF
ncbi:MAG: caspase family protein [Elusimicrobia bacterium]|nr:caspase family protein [Elusimicrobiota bacterium]MDE2237033.1 caspase family protein [Elusimicrobiota bacterium]